MVTKDGFPVAYDVFSGNTFEGKTIIPVVKNFIKKNKVTNFTIIADAAMISSENVKNLIDNKINYIVGARLGNVSKETLELIDKSLIKEENKTIRLKTDKGFLICGFSNVRYRKDKFEMEKQIEKAKKVVENPSKNPRTKFTKKVSDDKFEINQELIEKTKKLLGIKGYYTNLEENIANNQLIIERYHELYKIEQVFRISKNDLQTRPIFHYKEEPIRLHILICFIALVVSKHVELKTGISIKKFTHECKKISSGRILNQITNKEIVLKAKPNTKMLEYLSKIIEPH
jgi:transposase